ncbi:hypothetical protein OEZ85_007671 [Tetradesmus obliquus]|uniref:CSC1/OSCA1-like 7TM region domain-containing protein n=1 Tax=Tetradesmus obliquus TaxID=3088 RepID=A0ABY8TL49_TETOB|nr:hypothetical protein OEZ85_007671 [Tetradesmus obliquus]
MGVDTGKVSAFKAFEFDGNEEWKAHLRNVELPAGNPEAALLKVKSKWYKKTVDPDFDPAWLTGSTPSSQQQSSMPQQEQQQSSSARSAPQASSADAGAARAPQGYARQLHTALLQGIILLLALLYLQPLRLGLSSWAYLRLTVTLVASQALKLHSAFGMPGFNLAAAKAWWGRVNRTTDAHYFLLAVAAVINRPFTYLLVPFLVLAVYQLAFFLSEHHSSHPLWQQHGAKAYQWLLQRKQQALQVTAQVEIMNGFTLLALLLTPGRQPVLMLMVWQVLRLRYWSVDAAIHHRQVWQALDQLTAGFRYRFPILQKPVNMGVAFFQSARQ